MQPSKKSDSSFQSKLFKPIRKLNHVDRAIMNVNWKTLRDSYY